MASSGDQAAASTANKPTEVATTIQKALSGRKRSSGEDGS